MGYIIKPKQITRLTLLPLVIKQGQFGQIFLFSSLPITHSVFWIQQSIFLSKYFHLQLYYYHGWSILIRIYSMGLIFCEIQTRKIAHVSG
jgi:hypothetical protein